MDAVIAVKVSRTGVVLSCLFGQMAVCVLITDWVLDTVNTIKEETSFICSASPTHRHTRRKRDSRTHAKHRQKNSVPMQKWGAGKQAQKRTIIHTRSHNGAKMQLCASKRIYRKWDGPAGYKCWGTSRLHRLSPVEFYQKLHFSNPHKYGCEDSQVNFRVTSKTKNTITM